MGLVTTVDGRHGLSPILCDTMTVFVYVDQFSCRCIFVYCGYRRQLVTSLQGGFLYYFCLLAESYETIINQ